MIIALGALLMEEKEEDPAVEIDAPVDAVAGVRIDPLCEPRLSPLAPPVGTGSNSVPSSRSDEVSGEAD